ncbi:MAG: coenzyme F420-0:L-glutamate ligase [Candidatus Moraniibacteriota bacterium]
MNIRPVKTGIFNEGDDLVAFILRHVKDVPEQSVIVVTSKIVALSERRTVPFTDIESKEKLIRAESEYAVRTKHVWLTIKDGMLGASAGIDESNADGRMILLPKDSFESARILREELCREYGVRDLGILISDSRTIPLRAGVIGIATGYAGFLGIRDYRGKRDLFGRTLEYSRTDIADSLATAATLVMGEGDECQPLGLIDGAPVEFCDQIDPAELHIDIEDDMFTPLFSDISLFRPTETNEADVSNDI